MNAVEMNSSNVIKELYSQWDDSSLDDEPTASNSVNEQTSIPNEDLENLIREESIHLVVPCHENTILNIGESSQPDEEKSIDPSLDHLISEETVSDFDILEKPSSPITEPSPIKKKRGRKPKSKDTKPKTSKPKVTARKRNAKKFDDLDEPKKNTSRKQAKKSQPLKHGKDDDDATDTEKCNEDDDPKIGQLPSVYSRNQIAKHRKRINQLKQLEQDTDSESDVDTDAALDRDLDINLRIFEESAKSVDTVVGEIQCNFIDDQSCAEATNTNKIPVNVFQFTVNSNCVEICDNADDSENRISKKTSGSDNIEDISLFDDPMEYSDNDSDLEILVSKPIIRKRAAPHVKKEKHTEKKQKLTMYDLIHDNGPFSPQSKDEGSDIDQKDDIKLNEAKKIKTSNKNPKPLKKEEPAENAAECTQTTEQKDQNLPVPKLKIGADGEVVIDMDSLVIEQTGVSEARSALANSEVIEECSLSYNTYNKKNNFRKQWTPHETLKFYQVLSTIGTDFTLMATLFPGRTRKCMKRKFKREEKTNADLILKALSCKQNFNIDLLEKELQLKDEKLNQLKENNKKRKPAQKKEVNKKETKAKRKSFFQSSIQSFQNGET